MDDFKFDLQLFAVPEFPAVGTYLINDGDGTIGAGVDPDLTPTYTENAYYLVIAGTQKRGSRLL